MLFRFRVRAEKDIEEIAAFIAQDNPQRAVSYIEELRQQCRNIGAFPKAAPLRPKYGKGVRRIVFGQYLVLYVVRKSYVEIIRVLHGARELPRILKGM